MATEPHPPKLGTDGYWFTQWRTDERQPNGKPRQYRKTFGNEAKVSRAQATRSWRQWMARKGQEEGVGSSGNTVAMLVEAYNQYALDYYRRSDKTLTGEHYNISAALTPLNTLFGDYDLARFRPSHLLEYQEHLAEERIMRTTIVKWSSIVKRMLKWGVVNDFVSESVAGAVSFVAGPSRGRTKAPEPPPVKPVTMRILAKTIKHLSPTVSSMVRLQWLSAMRPGEVCGLSPEEVDRTRKTWLYAPSKHKMAHRQRNRVIAFGPKARAIITPLLFSSPCFKTTKGTTWTTKTYGDAIEKACKKAKLEVWTPNQIRHAAADRTDRHDDRAGARVILGHGSEKTTKIYITEDIRRAMMIAERAG